MSKKLITLLLATLLSVGIWAIASLPVFAVGSLPEMQLSESISNFLTSLPKDYYTITKTEDLKRLIQRQNVLLIDVRQPSEYVAGHIPHAINIPLSTLIQNLDQIPQNHPVILYCTTGYRTAMGVMTLQMLGYSNVRAFPPSFQGWKAAGEPVEQW